jgi:hypothetical protein
MKKDDRLYCTGRIKTRLLFIQAIPTSKEAKLASMAGVLSARMAQVCQVLAAKQSDWVSSVFALYS